MSFVYRARRELSRVIPGPCGRLTMATFLMLGMGTALWHTTPPNSHASITNPVQAATAQSADEPGAKTASPAEQQPLEVIRSRAGGLDRRFVQTGSIEALEAADVYAKVSGYLRAVHVNIGTRIEAGQVLAELDVPELLQEVKQKKTLLQQVRSEASQADAQVKLIQAQQETARAVVEEAASKIQQHVIERDLRHKEAERMRQLVAQGAVQEQLLDEKLHLLEMAKAAEERVRRTLRVAEAQRDEAGPRVELAIAESATAHAKVSVAAAAVEQAEIMLQYTRVVAPFTAVVTQRNVDVGDFVRAATAGGNEPLFRLLRTDHMKVVVAAPDRFVPYIRPGDPVEVRIDALHGRVFEGSVARVASFQQRQTRTMRVEVDLPNPDGRLIDGMYGSVTITSAPPSDSLTVPAASLLSGTENGRGSLFVVRDRQLVRLPVWLGQNDGVQTEVLSGLSSDDLVVSRATQAAGLDEGPLTNVRLEMPANDAIAEATSARKK